jgi:hypothetical protein
MRFMQLGVRRVCFYIRWLSIVASTSRTHFNFTLLWMSTLVTVFDSCLFMVVSMFVNISVFVLSFDREEFS